MGSQGARGLFVCLVWSGGLPRRFFVMPGTPWGYIVPIGCIRPPLIIGKLINVSVLAADTGETAFFPIIQEYTENIGNVFMKICVYHLHISVYLILLV